MNPLYVRYVHTGPVRPAERRAVLTRISPDAIQHLLTSINDGSIDEVVLVGPSICTGWRLEIPSRQVIFEAQVNGLTEYHRIVQAQAAARIINGERQ